MHIVYAAGIGFLCCQSGVNKRDHGCPDQLIFIFEAYNFPCGLYRHGHQVFKDVHVGENVIEDGRLDKISNAKYVVCKIVHPITLWAVAKIPAVTDALHIGVMVYVQKKITGRRYVTRIHHPVPTEIGFFVCVHTQYRYFHNIILRFTRSDG